GPGAEAACSQLAATLRNRGHEVRETTLRQLVIDHKRGWKDKGWAERLDRELLTVNVLVLRDLRRDGRGDLDRSLVDKYVRGRTLQQRAVFATSEGSPVAIGRDFGPAVGSLLHQIGQSVSVPAPRG